MSMHRMYGSRQLRKYATGFVHRGETLPSRPHGWLMYPMHATTHHLDVVRSWNIEWTEWHQFFPIGFGFSHRRCMDETVEGNHS